MTKNTSIRLFNEKQIRSHWDTEQLFRLIQSIPSPKAEPFKLWLSRVGRERIDEIEDPGKGIDRLE